MQAQGPHRERRRWSLRPVGFQAIGGWSAANGRL